MDMNFAKTLKILLWGYFCDIISLPSLLSELNFKNQDLSLSYFMMSNLKKKKKSEKNLITQRSCTIYGWKDEQSQIYKIFLLGWVSN